MTKKEIKKSRSAEDLTTKSQDKKIQELKDQVKFESQKAQNYLAQITELTAEVDSKEQTIKELSTERNQLTDQNSELRINNLKQDDYFIKYREEIKITQQLKLQLATLQKNLTIFQQDLKSAQRIIELRTIKPDNNQEKNPFNYWTWIRFGLLTFLTYLLLNNLQKPEINHGRPRN